MNSKEASLQGTDEPPDDGNTPTSSMEPTGTSPRFSSIELDVDGSSDDESPIISPDHLKARLAKGLAASTHIFEVPESNSSSASDSEIVVPKAKDFTSASTWDSKRVVPNINLLSRRTPAWRAKRSRDEDSSIDLTVGDTQGSFTSSLLRLSKKHKHRAETSSCIRKDPSASEPDVEDDQQNAASTSFDGSRDKPYLVHDECVDCPEEQTAHGPCKEDGSPSALEKSSKFTCVGLRQNPLKISSLCTQEDKAIKQVDSDMVSEVTCYRAQPNPEALLTEVASDNPATLWGFADNLSSQSTNNDTSPTYATARSAPPPREEPTSATDDGNTTFAATNVEVPWQTWQVSEMFEANKTSYPSTPSAQSQSQTKVQDEDNGLNLQRTASNSCRVLVEDSQAKTNRSTTSVMLCEDSQFSYPESQIPGYTQPPSSSGFVLANKAAQFTDPNTARPLRSPLPPSFKSGIDYDLNSAQASLESLGDAVPAWKALTTSAMGMTSSSATASFGSVLVNNNSQSQSSMDLGPAWMEQPKKTHCAAKIDDLMNFEADSCMGNVSQAQICTSSAATCNSYSSRGLRLASASTGAQPLMPISGSGLAETTQPATSFHNIPHLPSPGLRSADHLSASRASTSILDFRRHTDSTCWTGSAAPDADHFWPLPGLHKSSLKRKAIDDDSVMPETDAQRLDRLVGAIVDCTSKDSSPLSAPPMNLARSSEQSSVSNPKANTMGSPAASPTKEEQRPKKRQRLDRPTSNRLSLLKSAAKMFTSAAVAGVGVFAFLAASNPDPI